MSTLPQQLTLPMMQTQWAAQLNPLLANILTQGAPIGPVVLVANKPQSINHKLDRLMQGYLIASQNANAVIWFTQPFNSKTLTLESSANVTVNLWCY